MTISSAAARRRYRDRSSFTLASATSRLRRAGRREPLRGLRFRDDGEDLDFLVDEVIEHPELIHAETILRSTQPAHALDSTPGRFHRLAAAAPPPPPASSLSCAPAPGGGGGARRGAGGAGPGAGPSPRGGSR